MLTDAAKEKIKTRLKTFSLQNLLLAIENFSKAEWWMTNNGVRGMAWFFHTDDRIEQFLNLKTEVKSKGFIDVNELTKQENAKN